MNYNFIVNPHALRSGIFMDRKFIGEYYEELGIVFGSEEDLKQFIYEERKYIDHGVNPHDLRIGLIRDFDSKWYPEENEGKMYISDEMLHHSLQNRKIHLVQLFGKKKYKKITNKVKHLSR